MVEHGEELEKRMGELAVRAQRRAEAVFTHFLDPAQQAVAAAQAAARRIVCMTWGGYPDAERQMAAFAPEDDLAREAWPICAVEVSWNEKFAAPGHRDILGALMALGFDRERIGDIVVLSARALLFAEPEIGSYIVGQLEKVGRASVRCRLTQEEISVPPPTGRSFHDTVASLRLDAILAAGFSLSRAEAAQYVARACVTVNHLPAEKADLLLREGDGISARGLGKLRLERVEGVTKKGRVGVTLFRYGC